MRWSRAAVALLLALVAVRSGAETPLESVMPFLADLAARGGYGGQHAEQGAFLVAERDGTVSCRLWRSTGAFHRASTSGEVPRGTFAIAHTHPRSVRELSGHDRREAARLTLPVIAVSMGTLHIAEGDGKARPMVRGVDWARYLDPSRRCVTSP